MAAPGTAGSIKDDGRFGRPGDAGLLLLLSLFLLLLVFFIVLNAQSRRHPERVGAVLASVEAGFPAFVIDRRLRDDGAPLASRSGTVFAADRLAAIGDLFAKEVAIARSVAVTPGRLLEVRLPADALFLPNTATLRPERAGLLKRASAALGVLQSGERVEVDALLAIDDGTASQPPGPVQRAGALARVLAGDGTAAGVVAVGIERGEPGTVRFLFAVRSLAEVWR